MPEAKQCNHNEIREDIRTLQQVIFGNERTGDKGMKEKVDEMHEIIVAVRGWRALLYILIAIGGAVAVLKGWWK